MDIVKFIFDNRIYFEDFITRSTHHSNAIEGNTLSYAETYAIIFNDNSLTVKAEPREFYEAVNHKYALNYMMNNLKESLNQRFIINIAKLINKNISEIDGFRKTQVFINKAEFIPPPPSLIYNEMMYFVHDYNQREYDNTFYKAAEFHLRFERIHPFDDGNGRTGRILINYELLKNNLSPIVITKDLRAEYFSYLADQNIDGLALFFKNLSKTEEKRIEQFSQLSISSKNSNKTNDENSLENEF